jgi:hypothetical protein
MSDDDATAAFLKNASAAMDALTENIRKTRLAIDAFPKDRPLSDGEMKTLDITSQQLKTMREALRKLGDRFDEIERNSAAPSVNPPDPNPDGPSKSY